MEDFDQLTDWERNEVMTLALIDIKFLKLSPLPGTDIPAYIHQYISTDVHEGVNEYQLSKMLVFLMEREYLWPVTFPGTNIKHPRYPDLPFFIRTADIKDLPDRLFNSIEYFDIQEAAKFLMN